MGKWDKHAVFMENLCTRWEWTEAERAALEKTRLIKDYAVNVLKLRLVTPDQFFEQYPIYTTHIEQAMQMVETERQAKAATEANSAALEAKVAALTADVQAKLAEAQTSLTAKDAEIAQLKAAPPAAGE